MSYLGLATPQALCPRCLRRNGFLLNRTQILPSSLRCIGDGVGGWLHAQDRDGIQSARRHYHPSPYRFNSHREIVPESLQETLNLHRTLNRESLIRKVKNDERPSDTGMFRPELPHIQKKNEKSDNITKSVEKSQRVESEVSVEEGSFAGEFDIRKSEAEPEVTEPVVQIRHHKIWKKSRSRPSRHPFDPQSTSRTIPGLRRESISWIVDKGQVAQYPWLEKLSSEQQQPQHDGLSRLNAEIEAFERFIIPNSQEMEISKQVILDTATLIAEELGTSLPVCIGSRNTGMSLTHSDIDFLIPIKDPKRPMGGGRGPSATRPKAVRAHLECLKQVEYLLSNTGEFRHVVPTRARTPIVSAVHARTGLELQFQCGDEGRGTPSSQEYVKNYQVEFPSLRAIYAILRMSLEIRGLFGGVNSSVGTYGLTMMIVAALKLGDGTYHPRHDLGKQLLHVLQVYSDIDFQTTGVAVEPLSFFDKKASQKSNTHNPAAADLVEEESDNYDSNEESYLRGQRLISKISMKRTMKKGGAICIQDPADYANDLGRTCDVTRQVQKTFRSILRDLKEGIERWEENHDTEANANGKQSNPEKSLLGFALGANYEDLELARDKVLYGSWFK